MASSNLFLDTDYDTDGRSQSRQENTQSRGSGRNVLTVAKRNGSVQSGDMLEGMESSPRVDDHESNDRNDSPIEKEDPADDIHSDHEDEDKQSYAYSFGDYEDFESDTETPRKEKSDKSKGSKGVKLRVKEQSRRLPSSRWRTLTVFDDDEENPKKPNSSKKKSGNGKKKNSNNPKENAVRPQYMESSTESEEEDDRKLDASRLSPGELTSEFWQIQKLIKFVKIGNQTATLIALCALNDFDMRSEVCQMAVRDVDGLTVLTNMLKTDHDKCKIATMKLLNPLTDKSKYNRRELVRLGAMHSLVYHIAMSDNRDVVGWAARIIANMSQCSLARNILKQNDGIRKLVNLLDFEEKDYRRSSYPRKISNVMDKELLAKSLNVAKSAARALWSCCRNSQRCRVAVLKTGGVPFLAKLVSLENEDILVPVTGLIQECCVEKNFRVAVHHTNIIASVVNHLTRDNLELKTYGALTIFKCAEEKETRDIVYENDGIIPIIDLLSLKEKNALAAATGAIWKCAQSEVNARRFLHLDMMEMLLKYIHPQYHDEWTEEVQAHAVGAIGELGRVPEGRFEIYRCHGCEALIGMLGHPNMDISANVAKAIYNSSVDPACKMKFKQMDGIRLLWTLLKSFDDEVIINSAWALCLLIDDDQADAENIRSFIGGLEILVNLLKSENLEVLTSVCAVISEVAIDYQNVGIISDYDVVPLLAELTNVKDNRLRRYLAEAIARCGVFGDNAKAFRTSGAVSKVVKYLYIEDIPLQEATVRALYQLSRDPANCAIIHKHGGVKLLLEMVGSDDPDLQKAAAGCLANIRTLAVAAKNTKNSKKTRGFSSKSSN